jgi:sugar O-acyltransferase (sialic acid O-acetyltransferase NeuD family)
MSRLLIIGAGGHGVVVAEAAADTGRWQEILFLDDNASSDSVLEFPVAGTVDQLAEFATDDTEVVVAIGDNRKRLEICSEVLADEFSLATVVHPSVCVSNSASVSPGTVMCAGVIVNARARVGQGCIVNTAATVDHDCVIGDGAHISPGANLAGEVTVGECSWVGIGSSIREGVRIGSDAIVGAGAAVVADVEDGDMVGGVPARRLNNQ